MAYAISNQRPERASGLMALHQIEAMEGLLLSAHEKRYYTMKTTFARPVPLSVDFPESEIQ